MDTSKSGKSSKAITKTVVMGRNRGAVLRLQQDYILLKKDPVPYIHAEPLPSNILEWHYVITGPQNTPYLGGYYHGTLVFTQQYPFKPPSIYMLTPSGRFQTSRRLCLSISDYHPDEWNPAWSVSSILTGLLSFMLESSRALGSIETSYYEKLEFARQSLEFNLKDHNFTNLFPDLVKEIQEKLDERKIAAENAKKASADNDATGNNSTTNDANNVSNNGETVNYENTYGNLILIISFCLFALIVHHIYNSLVVND